MKRKTTINPIVDWLDEDVWEFLNDVAKVPHCCLYDEGFSRLGCIGCPLQGKDGMLRDFERWPRYKALYIKAFDRMIAKHPGGITAASGEMAKNGGGGYSLPNGSDGQYRHHWKQGGEKVLEWCIEQTRATDAVVADRNGGTKFPILDSKLLSGEAADTHTHTHKRTRKPYIEKNGTELLVRWMRKQ